MTPPITVADFCKQLQKPSEKFKSRLLITASSNDREVIFSAYGNEAKKIRISDFVQAEGFFPMPSRLFRQIEEVRQLI